MKNIFSALAGEQALRTGGYQVAQFFLSRALELQAQVSSPQRKQALLKQQLGDTLLGLRQTEEARQLYEDSLAQCRAIGYRWGEASNLNRLGRVAAEAKDYDQAASALVEALQVAMEARALAVAVNSLAEMSGLLAKAGNKVVALEYASLALNHPSCDDPTHDLAERVLDDLQEELPDNEYAAAVERGKRRELKEVAAAILKS